MFFCLSAIHFYWGLGGKFGKGLALPTNSDNEKVLNPTTLDCLAVGFVLLGMAAFILVKCMFVSFPLSPGVLNYGLWVLALIFTVRAVGDFKYVGFFKKIKHSAFAKTDTRYYAPLCLLIAVLMMVIQLSIE